MDRGLVDVGLLLEPVNIEKYDYIRLNRKEEWVVAMHPDSPLAGLKRITPKDLKGLPLILPNRTNLQSEISNWFGKDYNQLNILFTSNLSSTSTIMTHNRLAYSIIIRGSISFWDKEKITYRPLYPALKATSVLAWKRQPFGMAAIKFIDFMCDALKEESPEERPED